MVFGALVFKLSVWCGAVGYVSGLRVAVRKPDALYKAAQKRGSLSLHDVLLLKNTFFIVWCFVCS